MPRAADWKPLKQLRREVRLLKQQHLKYVSQMSRIECKKFIKYFGPAPSGAMVTAVEVPKRGKFIEYESDSDDPYED